MRAPEICFWGSSGPSHCHYLISPDKRVFTAWKETLQMEILWYFYLAWKMKFKFNITWSTLSIRAIVITMFKLSFFVLFTNHYLYHKIFLPTSEFLKKFRRNVFLYYMHSDVCKTHYTMLPVSKGLLINEWFRSVTKS